MDILKVPCNGHVKHVERHTRIHTDAQLTQIPVPPAVVTRLSIMYCL